MPVSKEQMNEVNKAADNAYNAVIELQKILEEIHGSFQVDNDLVDKIGKIVAACGEVLPLIRDEKDTVNKANLS